MADPVTRKKGDRVLVVKRLLLALLVCSLTGLAAMGQNPSYGSGFTSTSALTLNGFGAAAATSGTSLRLTDGGTGEARSVFYSTLVNIASFSNQFTFKDTSAKADGLCFVIQNSPNGPAALGTGGGDLGYAPSSGALGTNSLCVAFDLYNSLTNAEISNTGLFQDGTAPNHGAGSPTGLSFQSGDVMSVTMNYDGTTLTLQILDQTTHVTFSTSFPVNIPAIVGGNTAYVGFTAGDGGLSSIQDIQTWTYTPGTSQPQAATPSISPASGTQSSPVSVTITDSTSGATITYTTDGSAPVPGTNGTAIPSGGSFSLSFASTATVKAVASAGGFSNSAIATAAYTSPSGGGTPNYGSGFTSTSALTLNGFAGAAATSGTSLRLTDGGTSEARSVFYSTLVNIGSFSNQFTFKDTSAKADGLCFVIQNSPNGPAALGSGGGALGYAGTSGPLGTNSLCIAFDLYNSATNTEISNTGLFTDGNSPAHGAGSPAGSLSFQSGHVMSVQMTYDGTTLNLLITDTATNTTFSTSFTVNIAAIVGGNTAYVGFTGGDGGLTSIQDIQTWTYSSQAPTATPSISPSSGTQSSPVTVTITDSTPGATITYTTDGSTPVPGTNGTAISSGGSFSLSFASTATVNAIASASGFSNSAVATATYTTSQSPAATPSISPGSGTQSSPVTVTLTDNTPGATITYTTDGTTPVPGSHGTAISSGGSFSLSFTSTTTVTAIASASGFANSAIATATYTAQSPAATPSISPGSGTQSSPVTVTLTDSTPGATITYTTDGTTPVPGSHGIAISSGGSFSLSFASTATVNAIASASGFANSAVATATYTTQSGGGSIPSFGSGFPSSGSGLTLNGFGSASAFNGTRLRLTDGGAAEGRSAFFGTQVSILSFITDFKFQLTNASADGFTFTIQSSAPTALGGGGGSLGYGPTSSKTGTGGIPSSVAVKFDLFNNSGEGSDSTGLYTNGASPTTPAVDMTNSGINLHSGDVMNAHLAYDGTTLTLIITDTSTNASFQTSFTVNIPSIVGGGSAFVGFTGGSGGQTAIQDILTWRFTPVSVTAFTWPVATPITYAVSNCGPANDYSFYCAETPIFGQYHTGIDVCPQSPGCAIGNPVNASSSGVVELALVVSDASGTLCDGSSTAGYQINPSTSNLGNVIVIAHPNGKFTLYGHLDCIAPGVVPGLQVTAATRIGNMGHSGFGTRDQTFEPHTHFEMKDRAVTGDPTNKGYSGYTTDLPDGYGYHDARILINSNLFSPSAIPPAAVKVVASSAQTVFTGPDASFAALATIAPNQEFATSMTSGSWYKIDMPNDNGPVSGWVEGGSTLVTTDPAATLLQVTGASGSGLTIQAGHASGTNLVSWDQTFQNCTPTAKIWNGQRYVSIASQSGFNEFYLPLNYHFSSANSCAEPSGPGPSVGWASSTVLH